jgi:hypothetical protein
MFQEDLPYIFSNSVIEFSYEQHPGRNTGKLS